MEVKQIEDKTVWEGFLLEQRDKTFLQSWNWGEFQEKMGNKIWRLGVFEGSSLVGLALVAKVAAKRGTFLLIQHGPLGKGFGVLFGELKKIAKEEGASFIRVAPLLKRNEENKKLFSSLGFKPSPMHASAYEATWKMDLSPSEEELLAGMRKTTRYLIRQTLKNKDIVIEKSDRLEDIELYQKLNVEVAKRQGFVPFSLEHTKNELETFLRDGQALLLFGKYQGEVAAVALVIFWSGIGFYHQAASSVKHSKLSIPYLLQWEAIREAKSRGCALYDFWGYVDPIENPKHPWAGPTLFKMGFGGRVFQYLETQDLPLSSKYWLTFIFEKIRRLKRGL